MKASREPCFTLKMCTGTGFLIWIALMIGVVGVPDLHLLGTQVTGLLTHTGDGPLVLFHQQHLAGTPRGGFETEGAASGVEIQASGASNGIREPVEQRLADPVGGRPQTVDVGHAQPAAAPCSRDNAYFAGHAGAASAPRLAQTW